MKTQEELKKQYLENRQWFIDRIGKRVFRTDTKCCAVCAEIYKNGLVIHDETHASYLNDISAELGVRYFDTKQEVVEYENRIQDIKDTTDYIKEHY